MWTLYQRLVGLCYLATFLSLLAYTQIVGLIGPLGVQPATLTVELIKDHPLRFPSIFSFLAPSSGALLGTTAVGAAASVLAVANVQVRASLLIAWACFLSICTVGGEFFAYPWDSLLLEAGALAVLVSPEPNALVCFAQRFLAFRLQLGMGMQKFYAVDAQSEWWKGTYLDTFYVWQPMPTLAAWYAHHAGHPFHWLSTRVVLVSQSIVPFGMFGPRRVRLVCVLIFLSEQVWIQLTGNYGIFNLLTAVLCSIPLVAPVGPLEAAPTAGLAALNVFGGAFFLVRRLLVGTFTSHYPWLSATSWLFSDGKAFEALPGPRLLRPLYLLATHVLRAAAPYRACNDYGIFRTGFGQPYKLVTVLLGHSRTSDESSPLVLRTGFHQATSGDAETRLNTRFDTSLPSWFAPHQPRLDHSFFYAGMQLNIGVAISHEQHHLAPIATPDAFLGQVERALLRCPNGTDVRSLFAAVPSDVDALRRVSAECHLADDAPHTRPWAQMWRCTALTQEEGEVERPPVDATLNCSIDVFELEEKAWIGSRRRALQSGLEREARLQRPPLLDSALALLVLALCTVPTAPLRALLRARLRHLKTS